MSSALSHAQGVALFPSSTSYFSQAAGSLDPALFDGDHLKPWVRSKLLGMLMAHLVHHYNSPERWTRAWVAGSGVSFQWEASRSPGDLDVLVGVDYPAFRASNTDYVGLSDAEISRDINESFNTDLTPFTRDWHGYEVTFYSNPWATDITAINPYAAYDLDRDEWTVPPDPRQHAPHVRAWEDRAQRDHDMANDIVRRYSQALTDVRSASNPAYRVNAERRLNLSMDEAIDLFDQIHRGRKQAFSPMGTGYADWGNYRWQAGKASGVVSALRQIKDYRDAVDREQVAETYGVELPTSEVLTRRAALAKRGSH